MVFEKIKNQNFLPSLPTVVSPRTCYNSARQVCGNCNKNLNWSTLVSIRYTNERSGKDLKGVEMYICITNSHARKRLRTLGSRVLYDKETVYVLQYTSAKCTWKYFFCKFYCCWYTKKVWYMTRSAVEIGVKQFLPKNLHFHKRACVRVFSFFSIPFIYKLFIWKLLKFSLVSFPSQLLNALPKSLWAH